MVLHGLPIIGRVLSRRTSLAQDGFWIFPVRRAKDSVTIFEVRVEIAPERKVDHERVRALLAEQRELEWVAVALVHNILSMSIVTCKPTAPAGVAELVAEVMKGELALV